MKTFEFTEEQIEMIKYCICTTIYHESRVKDEMFDICGLNDDTLKTGKEIYESIMRKKTLLDYINS